MVRVKIVGAFSMASDAKVQQYIAHWFQLGKGIQTRQGQVVKPQKVFVGDRYTPEFQDCWQIVRQDPESHLEGTHQTIAELLSDRWEITDCARCAMPIPLVTAGLSGQHTCPCHDIPNWPNNELPMPRSPIEVGSQTAAFRQRLASAAATTASQLD
jgi:hypothetical protein